VKQLCVEDGARPPEPDVPVSENKCGEYNVLLVVMHTDEEKVGFKKISGTVTTTDQQKPENTMPKNYCPEHVSVSSI